MFDRRVAALSFLLVSMLSVGGAQTPAWNPHWPGPGQLFVGTCYQPIDRSPEQIERDITITKNGGFNVVRMGGPFVGFLRATAGRVRFRLVRQDHGPDAGGRNPGDSRSSWRPGTDLAAPRLSWRGYRRPGRLASASGRAGDLWLAAF